LFCTNILWTTLTDWATMYPNAPHLILSVGRGEDTSAARGTNNGIRFYILSASYSSRGKCLAHNLLNQYWSFSTIGWFNILNISRLWFVQCVEIKTINTLRVHGIVFINGFQFFWVFLNIWRSRKLFWGGFLGHVKNKLNWSGKITLPKH
jgi:hypothetical protein